MREPPALNIPAAMNCPAPVKQRTDMATACRRERPASLASTPKVKPSGR